MKSKSFFSVFIFVVIFAIGVTVAYFFYGGFNILQAEITAVIAFLLAMVISSAIKKQATRQGLGLTAWQIPLAQRAGAFSYHPDIRHHTLLDRHSRDYHFFKAEKTLTKDTVPVDLEAVVFWKVLNPQKAALEVADLSVPSVGHHSYLLHCKMQCPCRRRLKEKGRPV